MQSLLSLAFAFLLLVSPVSLLSVNEAWVERVNKNLLPLLNKFSIKRQGPFGLSNVITPVVNVSTLEEEQALSQQTAFSTGTLTTAGGQVILVVVPGQTWNVEHVVMGSVAGLLSAHRDAFFLFDGTNIIPMKNDQPDTGVTVFGTGFQTSFSPPLVLTGGQGFVIQRQVTGAATTSSIWIHYRRAI